MQETLARRLFAELLGSCLLAATVIGSGILAVQLSGDNDGVALLGNTLATAAILYVLVSTLGPVSGAHFNPAVTLVMVLRGDTRPADAALYMPLQVIGCVLGAVLAHAMFGLPLLQEGAADRSGMGRLIGEGAATFALVFAILGAPSATVRTTFQPSSRWSSRRDTGGHPPPPLPTPPSPSRAP